MARSRVVQPETERLPLSEGDWILVKKTLTYGDTAKSRAVLVKEIRTDGRVTPDFELVEIAQVLSYLVDWSFVDPTGKRIPIDTESKKLSAINSLEQKSVRELIDVVDAYATAQDAARSAEKNDQTGSPESDKTS